MGESKLKRFRSEEMLLSCAGVQTAGGRVKARWEAGSAATPMGQLAYFIEFLTLTGLWSGGRNDVRCPTAARMRRARPMCWGRGCCRPSRGTGAIRTSRRYAVTGSIRACWG